MIWWLERCDGFGVRGGAGGAGIGAEEGVVAGEVEMEEIEGAQRWGWELVSLRRRQEHRRGRCDVIG